MQASQYLPHRYPFVMLDTVEVAEEGGRGTGAKLVTERDRYVTTQGELPDVFVIEAMAHLSGIVSGRSGGAFLSALKNIEFTGRVRAGQVLELESQLEGEYGGMFIFACSASSDGTPVATGSIILKLGA